MLGIISIAELGVVDTVWGDTGRKCKMVAPTLIDLSSESEKSLMQFANALWELGVLGSKVLYTDEISDAPKYIKTEFRNNSLKFMSVDGDNVGSIVNILDALYELRRSNIDTYLHINKKTILDGGIRYNGLGRSADIEYSQKMQETMFEGWLNILQMADGTDIIRTRAKGKYITNSLLLQSGFNLMVMDKQGI